MRKDFIGPTTNDYKVKDSQKGRKRDGRSRERLKGRDLRKMSYPEKLKYYDYWDCLFAKEILDLMAIRTQLKRGKKK